MQNYVYYEENGKGYYIFAKTGEIINAEYFSVPAGSYVSVKTPEQLENYKKKITAKAQRSDNPFYFVNKNKVFTDISPSSVTRLIYLNSYRNFANDCLMLTERTKMTVKDLPELLQISKSNVSAFLNEVVPEYLIINEDKTITPNNDIFYKGKINRKTWMRVYSRGIQKLYKYCAKKYSKSLGYVFAALPYINFKYNVLCYNPQETDPNKIQKMTITEFCDIVNYDRKHFKRLIAQINEIIFKFNDHNERFCCYVNDGINTDKSYMVVNPRIIYAGNTIDDVKVFGNFIV